MAKPNQNSTVAEMRAYIRAKKLNHPLIKMGLKKAELQAGLKKLGHWEEKAKEKKTRKKAEPKKEEPKKPKPAPKKAEPKKEEKKIPMTTIVIKVKNYGRGINKSELSGFKKLSQKEAFGAKSKPQPENIGNEYYLKEVTTQAQKDELKELSEGYPSEISFFSISSLNKKFGFMGEKSISHSKIRSGDY
jgi:outer membrane biosynthesis protein TonB